MPTDQPTNPKTCEHQWVTSTRELGSHCCECGEPLVSLFDPLSRNTPAGALLYALRKAQPTTA